MPLFLPASPFEPADQALLELARALREGGYRFTTVTPATHARANARPQKQWATGAADVFGWSRPFQSGFLAPEIERLAREADVLEACRVGPAPGFRATVRLSTLDDELFWHSAYPTSAADAVFFGPDTYRFALAIEAYFSKNSPTITRAVDLCCGAGPGALVVAKRAPGAEVFALDINDAALRLCRINAALAGTQNVEARNSDLLKGVTGDFDLIVANPPYLVDSAERAYRHGGGPLGAALSLAIVDAALRRLQIDGTLLLYTGVAMLDNLNPFRAAVADQMAAYAVDWHLREVDPDVFGEEIGNGAYADCDRIAAVVLEMTRRE